MTEEIKKTRQPLAQVVANNLEELIKSQKYNIGDKLPNEFELATELNVGRGTIREAIKLMAARNIVEIRRGTGTFVSETPGISEDPLGLSFIADKKKLSQDLMEMRSIIEPEIARLAAEHATVSEIEQMEALCLAIENLIQNDCNHEELDIELHTLIAKSSRNLVVPSLKPIIQTAISLFIDLTNRHLKDETIKTHAAIVSAIKQGDGTEAKKQMAAHLQYNKTALHIE